MLEKWLNHDTAVIQPAIATVLEEQPIYGAFLYGKDWRFSVLHEKNYCISKTYDASEKLELLQIVGILRQLKEIILTELVAS